MGIIPVSRDYGMGRTVRLSETQYNGIYLLVSYAGSKFASIGFGILGFVTANPDNIRRGITRIEC